MSKGTTHRSIRVDDALWEEAKAAASENSETISDIIRQALWQYIEDHTTKGDQMNISDEAVEAASYAMREVTPPPGVECSDWLKEHGPFALLAGAIAAAAPYLMAQAWDEGYDARASEYPFGDVYYNPYRKDTL